MSEANELLAFVQECGRTLAVGGAIEEFGVSRILACFLRGRVVKVGTNGSLYWVTADLSWNLPSDVGIMWAPAGTYRRAKLFEREPGPPSTGDDAFDAGYVVVGVGSAGEIFAPQVPPAVRQALLDFVDVRPDIGWVAPQLDRQLHAKSQPALRTNERVPGFAVLGSDLFTPAYAAGVAERTVLLAERIESSR